MSLASPQANFVVLKGYSKTFFFFLPHPLRNFLKPCYCTVNQLVPWFNELFERWCVTGGKRTTPPHLFTFHRHKDNNSCHSSRRRLFVWHKLIDRKGVTGLKNWQTVFAGRFPQGFGTFEIMCECRGLWMKNSCVIVPCCFCQECVIFFLLSSSLPQFAVILICPSKLAFFFSPCFSSSPF